MAKRKDALLELDPEQELIFKGPFNRSISKNLILTNPSKSIRVAFKMKTTSPRLFFVRPNIGILDPKQQVTVEIYVQPLNQRPEMKQKRHKFLILAAEVLAGVEIYNLQDFWKVQKPNDIWDTKIKCLMVPDKEERMREAGGGAEPLLSVPTSGLETASQNDQDGAAAATGAVVDGSMSNLRNQVIALQEERQQLLEKITLYHKDPVAPDTDSVPGLASGDSSKGRRFFYITAVLIAILAAIVVAFAAGQLNF